MKRKILSLILVVAMLVCYMPAMTFATEVSETDPNAVVKLVTGPEGSEVTKYYDSLSDAVAAVEALSAGDAGTLTFVKADTTAKIAKDTVAYLKKGGATATDSYIVSREVAAPTTADDNAKATLYFKSLQEAKASVPASTQVAIKFIKNDEVAKVASGTEAYLNDSSTLPNDYIASRVVAAPITANANNTVTLYFDGPSNAINSVPTTTEANTTANEIIMLKDWFISYNDSSITIQAGQNIKLTFGSNKIVSACKGQCILKVYGALDLNASSGKDAIVTKTYAADAVEKGSPAFTSTGAISVLATGDLTIENGTYDLDAGSAPYSYDLFKVAAGGKATIKGGTFNINVDTISEGKGAFGIEGKASAEGKDGNLNIQNGTFVVTQTDGATINADYIFRIGGEATISAGAFTNNTQKKDFYVKGKLSISGGSFSTKADNFVYTDSTAGAATEVTITAGTIEYKGNKSLAKGLYIRNGKLTIGNTSAGPTIKNYLKGNDENFAFYLEAISEINATINNGIISNNGTGIFITGNNGNKAYLEIKNGQIKDNVYGISVNQDAQLTIQNGTFSSYTKDIKNNSGSIVINGGTYAKTFDSSAWVRDRYYAVKPFDGKYVVCKSVDITIADIVKEFDGTPVSPVIEVKFMDSETISNATLDIQYHNLAVEGDTNSLLTSAPSAAGSYKVKANIKSDDTNYICSKTGGVEKTFTITKKKVYLTVNDLEAPIGDKDAKFTFKTCDKTGAAVDITETTFKAYLAGLTNSNVTIKDAAGKVVAFDDAIKTVGNYSIEVSGTVPATISANYDVVLNKKFSETEQAVTATFKVKSKTPAEYGFALNDSAIKDGIVTLDTTNPVITTESIGTALGSATKAVNLVLDGTLAASGVKTVRIPVDQFKTLYEYTTATDTKSKVAGLTVILSEGTMNLNKDAIAYIYKNQGTGASCIDINMEAVAAADVSKNTDLSQTDVTKALSELEGLVKVMNINITSKKEAMSGDSVSTFTTLKKYTGFGSGVIKVTVPLQTAAGKKGSEYAVYYLSDDAELEDMEATYEAGAGDETSTSESGTLTFSTTHCSYYPVSLNLELKVCDGGVDCPSYKYQDLLASEWYHEYVDYMLENGIMKGTSDTKFSPQDTVTRAMVVTMLYRISGEPSTTGMSTKFVDIDATQWYGKAVKWAYNKQIVAGIDDTHFGPDDPVTREQLSAMLYRYYTNYLGKTITSSEYSTVVYMNSTFADYNKVQTYATDAMRWMVKQEILSGEKSGSTMILKPQDGAKRQEIAKIFTIFHRDILEA